MSRDSSPAFTFGIEEEFFLADAATGRSPDAGALDGFPEAAAAHVEPASHELLKGQVEVQSGPDTDLDAAHGALAGMRAELSRIAGERGLALFAAGSHPLAIEDEQHTTQAPRYRQLEEQFGAIAARSMVCAMHIHVAVPEPGERIALMNRVMPYLPLFLALSTSSPFWRGEDSRLKGFRLAAFSEWPRMGLPELFSEQSQYDRFIARLVDAGVMENASFVWWLIRPSNKYPTLELRVCDSCTRLDDAVAIAALYRSLLAALHRRPAVNAGFGPVERGITAENIWQAQRAGIAARFIDPAGEGTVGVAEMLDAALALCAEEADALGAAAWAARTRDILARGSSADRQLRVFREAGGAAGGKDEDALRAVVRSLAAETAG